MTLRQEPASGLGEREMLEGWLEYHRATLAWKCDGLSADQLRERAVAARHASLDDVGIRRGEEFSLRWIFVHMIEEYARHNGHADLLRQRLDGQTGD